MKKLYIFVISLIIITAFVGAASCSNSTTTSSTPTVNGTVSPTPEQADFNFVFNYSGNILDTFKRTYTRDMIMETDITIDFTLTQEEIDRIYQKMAEIDFFRYPEKFEVTVPPGELYGVVTPADNYYFKVEYESKIKQLWWTDNIVYSDDQGNRTYPDEKGKKLKELINFIKSIIESKAEYQQLPKPVGGYI